MDDYNNHDNNLICVTRYCHGISMCWPINHYIQCTSGHVISVSWVLAWSTVELGHAEDTGTIGVLSIVLYCIVQDVSLLARIFIYICMELAVELYTLWLRFMGKSAWQ